MKHRKRIKRLQRKYYPVNKFMDGIVDIVHKRIIDNLETRLLSAFGIDREKFEQYKIDNDFLKLINNN